MKVVIFNDTYGELGGAETYFFYLARLLAGRGHRVSLAGFGSVKKRTNQLYIYKETKFFLFRYFWRLTFNPVVYFSLRKWLKKQNPDIIHLLNINKYTLALLMACRGFRVVHTVLDFGLVCPSKWAVRRDTLEKCPDQPGSKCWQHRCLPWYHLWPMCFFNAIRKLSLNKVVDSYTAESPIMSEYLTNYGYGPVVHSLVGLEINDWPYRQKEGFHYKLLYVGFLDENKGVRYLRPIMEQIIRQGIKCQLDIVGDGPLKKELINDFKVHGITDSVNFLGRKKIEELKKFYYLADFLLVPSIWMDNGPLVIMQSMACGTPVVGFARGGIPWQISKAGVLAKPDDINDFATAIVNNYRNKEKWHDLSKAARVRAERVFNAQNNILNIEDIYHNLVRIV